MAAGLHAPREEGVGLALSGGGFRATLFHIGSLWRLNEFGWLPRLTEVTSVSGGSITAALLGLRWRRLQFEANGTAANLLDEVLAPLRAFCSRTIDVGSIVAGLIVPFQHPGSLIAAQYRKRLFGDATLQDLPGAGEGPRFTIYATSLQTGAGVRFSRPYLGEYHLGLVRQPTIPLAIAVAASSAFPPPLCPIRLDLDPGGWERVEGADLYDHERLRSVMLLGDGGIYDNLGLERIWDRYGTVLVSDAGAPLGLIERSLKLRLSQVARTTRALGIITEQTRALRKRRLIGDYINGTRRGTYWGISTRIGDYDLAAHGDPAPIVQDSAVTRAFSAMRTRLNRFTDEEQEGLINWGYALADAAMRRHVLPGGAPPGMLPYPQRPI